MLKARDVEPLYRSADPDLHAPSAPLHRYRADLSYLGTYALERQPTLDELFIEPAKARPMLRFAVGGSQYPLDFPWQPNVFYHFHVPPAQHASYYCSARLNLNVTRHAMARMGYCPSGRLFEAAACGAALISDAWEGLDNFYEPEREILIARTRQDVLSALERSDAELNRMAALARERTLEEHSTERRAEQLVQAISRRPRTAPQNASLSMGE